MARPICLMLLTHCALRAASRAACTAGNSRAIRTAMIAITTSNSIRVKPRRVLMDRLLQIVEMLRDEPPATRLKFEHESEWIKRSLPSADAARAEGTLARGRVDSRSTATPPRVQ